MIKRLSEPMYTIKPRSLPQVAVQNQQKSFQELGSISIAAKCTDSVEKLRPAKVCAARVLTRCATAHIRRRMKKARHKGGLLFVRLRTRSASLQRLRDAACAVRAEN